MAFIPVPATAKFSIEGRQENQLIVNTLWVRKLSNEAFSETDVQNVCNLIRNAWATNIMIHMGQHYGLSRVAGRAYHVADGAVAEALPAEPVVGGNPSNNPYPANMAFCLSLKTGLAGRSRRGRMYLAGIHKDMCSTPSVMELGVANNFATGLGQIITDIYEETALSYRAVVVSFYEDGEPRPTGVATTITSVSYSDLRLDTQNRRLPGNGV